MSIEHEALSFVNNTATKEKYQVESIRQQIAQQDAIIQNAARIIEKAISDQKVAENAKEYFLQQLASSSSIKSPVLQTEKDEVGDAILRVLAINPSEEGRLIKDIHKDLPIKTARNTVIRALEKLIESGAARQANPQARRNRKYILV